MTLLETVTKGAGDASKWAASHPEAVTGVLALLSTRDTSVGAGAGWPRSRTPFDRRGSAT